MEDKKEINIMTPQFERTHKLDYDHKPSTSQEFLEIIKSAPYDILIGMGFGKWSTMNTCILENQQTPAKKKVKLNTTASIDELVEKITEDSDKELSGPPIEIDLGRKKEAPMELLEVDEDILLIPGEWYNQIPDGFMVTGLSGEPYPFKKNETDDDIRFGCLAYGIRRIKS